MFDLSNFRDRCCYCFQGIGRRLGVCSCGLALCSGHRALHTDKFGCHVVFEVCEDPAGAIAVVPVRDCAEEPDVLARRITTLIAAGDAPECPHVQELRAAPAPSTVCCVECGFTENLWACVGCGHVGCGRGQAERKGNGHALAHFEAAGAPLHVAAASLSSPGQVHCYVCDSYVRCPNVFPVAGEENKEESCAKDSGAKEADALSHLPFVGVVNAGQTCYVASVLQLLSSAFSGTTEEPSVHFSLCCLNPLHCLCCQFVRILGALSQKTQENALNIADFLALLEKEMPEYAVGTQQDCTEFLQALLARIAIYEEAMLLPPLTQTISIPVTTFISCESCGRSNSTRTKEAVLYVNYAPDLSEAVSDYFAPASTPCSCGATAVISPTVGDAASPEPVAPGTVLSGPVPATPPPMLPRAFLVAVKRYCISGGALSKITTPIAAGKLEITDYLRPGAGPTVHKSLALKGCVVHTGSSLHCGHYTWWTRHDRQCVVVDDEHVKASDEQQLQNGVVFLFE